MGVFDGLSTRLIALVSANKRKDAFSLVGSRAKTDLASTSRNHLFLYTSGRWLYGEQSQLDRRYVKFNVEALRNIASHVLNAPCSRLTKLPEGLYNKVFSLETEEDEEVLARIPNPNAGSPHNVVASEVATLDFRMKGRQLSDVWEGMSEAQRFGLVKNVVAIEAKLAKVNMPAYGSLYYRDNYPNGVAVRDSGRFVLGPTTEKLFWVDGRGSLELNRGPWTTAVDYIRAVAKREIACIRNSVTNEASLLDFRPKELAREAHIHLLQQFLTVLPHILPAHQICRPVLLHHDLHMDNIFVDNADPTRISGIIDWQGTSAAPLFMQARFPSVFDYEGPYPWGPVQPQLPDDFEHLSKQEKENAKEEHHRIRLKKFYEMASRKFNPDIPNAMDAMMVDDDPTSFIFHLLGQTSVDGPIPLQELIIQIFEKWDFICARRELKVSCPINFTHEEIIRCRRTAQDWAEAYNEFSSLLAQVGGKDGWVSHDEFEGAARKFNEHKEELEKLRKRVDEVLDVL